MYTFVGKETDLSQCILEVWFNSIQYRPGCGAGPWKSWKLECHGN